MTTSGVVLTEDKETVEAPSKLDTLSKKVIEQVEEGFEAIKEVNAEE